jgi:two-component system, sensor histidine kinase and response regulator
MGNTITSTILIVDDDADCLNILLELINSSGYKALVSTSGEDALQKAATLSPDLIILDVMMPGMDGFETCRKLKENVKIRDIPVIFVTALSETVNKVKGFEAGGVDYITKPYQNEEVMSRVNAHLMIRKQGKELVELNASKDKFFSILAHDMKNPLTVFMLYIRMLEKIDKLSTEEIKTIAGNLIDSAKNLFNLLDNLLEWARVQRGLMDFVPETIDMRSLIHNNVSLFNPFLVQKGITLNNKIKNDIKAYGDLNMIDTVVRNVVSNAIKFTKTGGKVEISAAENKGMVEVSVSDSGIGIPEDMLSKLFRIDSKFQQPDTSGDKGTGLGLILCKDLIEKNNGTIHIESVPDQGTTVKLVLPVSAG